MKLITVEMLLNHTCGIDGEYFPDAGPDAQRIEDVIPRIARQGQIHAPGAELSCNSGAVLAGYLAQRRRRPDAALGLSPAPAQTERMRAAI